MTEQRSQCDMLLEHLQIGLRITMLEALSQYGIAHLPRRIKDLEDRGHIIIRETIEVVKANGKKAFVTQYSYARENYQRKEVREPELQFYQMNAYTNIQRIQSMSKKKLLKNSQLHFKKQFTSKTLHPVAR